MLCVRLQTYSLAQCKRFALRQMLPCDGSIELICEIDHDIAHYTHTFQMNHNGCRALHIAARKYRSAEPAPCLHTVEIDPVISCAWIAATWQHADIHD
jgi:hypothetical protein